VEKHIVRWSYWLGMACFVAALVWKVLLVLGLPLSGFRGVTYMTPYKGGLMLLVIAIASTSYAWFKAQKP